MRGKSPLIRLKAVLADLQPDPPRGIAEISLTIAFISVYAIPVLALFFSSQVH